MVQTIVNEKYYPIYTTKHRYKILYGGRAGGRSYAAVQYFLSKMLQEDYFRGYFIREVYSDVRESLFRDFKDLINQLQIQDQFVVTENTMKIEHTRTGNVILSKGFKKSAGNQTAKLKSIAGATHVIIEEADETHEQNFDKLDDSLRTKKSECEIILLFNPPTKAHWLYKRFFGVDSAEDSICIHTTYKDNLSNVNESTIKKLERYQQIDLPTYQSVTLGQWSDGVKGRIFDDFEIIEEFPKELIDQQVFGLDFGFNPDPVALIRIAAHNKNLYLDEVIYETDLTNFDLHNRIIEMGINPSRETFVADAAEPKSIQDLKNMRPRWNVFAAMKGADSIINGIHAIKEYKVFCTRRSKNLIFENQHYRQSADAFGKLSGKPIDAHNHGYDAVRYGIQKIRHNTKRRLTLGKMAI